MAHNADSSRYRVRNWHHYKEALHLLRYYGWYSNVNRGKRKKAEEQAQHAAPTGTVEIPPPPGSSLFTQRWAELIKIEPQYLASGRGTSSSRTPVEPS